VLVSHRDMEETVNRARAPFYFRVFHLYKQSSSEMEYQISKRYKEMELAAAFLLAHFHTHPCVSFG